MDWLIPEALRPGITPAVYMTIAIAAVLLIGFSKGGFGGGVGILATPLLLIALPGPVAISMILPLLIVCDIFTWRHFPTDWDPPSYGSLATGTVVGLGIGLWALVWFAQGDVDGDRWIKLIVGSVALIFCVGQVFKIARKQRSTFTPGFKTGAFTGIFCGFSTMVSHAAGPFVNMYLLARKVDRKAFVGTCARYYLTFNVTKVPLYLLAGYLAGRNYITGHTLKWDLWLVPLCPFGVAAGAWLNKRMSGRVFTIIIYIALAITGLKLIWDSTISVSLGS